MDIQDITVPLNIISDIGAQRASFLAYLVRLLKYSKLDYLKINYTKEAKTFKVVAITAQTVIGDLVDLGIINYKKGDRKKIQVHWKNLYERYPNLLRKEDATEKLLKSENMLIKLWVNHNLPLPESLSQELQSQIISRITEWGKIIFGCDYNEYNSLYRRYKHNSLLVQFLLYVAKLYIDNKEKVSNQFLLSFSDYNKSFEILHKYISLYKKIDYKVMLDVNDPRQVSRFMRVCKQLSLITYQDLKQIGVEK